MRREINAWHELRVIVSILLLGLAGWVAPKSHNDGKIIRNKVADAFHLLKQISERRKVLDMDGAK